MTHAQPARTAARMLVRPVVPLLALALAAAFTAAAAQAITPPPVGTPAPAAKSTAKPGARAVPTAPREVDWDELLPKDARARFLGGPPPPVHDTLGEGGLAAQQVMDFSVNKDLDGDDIKIPGFIVPLDIGKDGLVSEFFLVPYFGACIHVPPPPPNQIVLVRYAKGISLDDIYAPLWVEGPLKIEAVSNDLADAAYTMTATRVRLVEDSDL